MHKMVLTAGFREEVKRLVKLAVISQSVRPGDNPTDNNHFKKPRIIYTCQTILKFCRNGPMQVMQRLNAKHLACTVVGLLLS